METINIYLGEDGIYTNAVGIKQLLSFYDKCVQYKDCIIKINLDNLLWLDGNLCAMLGGIIYQLKTNNNLQFCIDAAQVVKKCQILFSNEFIPVEQNLNLYKKDSCIPFKGFYPKQKDEFTDYIEYEVLSHHSMPNFSSETKDKLIDDLIEVYGNIDKHADTNHPFFVCGQHFPKQAIVRFTLCDLGVGFYKKIQARKPEIVKNHGDAILWAIKGNSTKSDAPGGKGLFNLHKYFKENNGGIQIFSGDTNWCSKTMEQNVPLRPNGIHNVNLNFVGATINLEFNLKTLIS